MYQIARDSGVHFEVMENCVHFEVMENCNYIIVPYAPI